MADHTRAIEQIVPGIETSRFLSGDINYMESVIFSFVETVKTEKKRILKDVMKLASDYGLDQTKVCHCLCYIYCTKYRNTFIFTNRVVFCSDYI